MIAANIAESAALGFHSCFPDSVMGFVLANAMGNVEYFLLFAETAKADLLAFALATATAQKTISLEILSSLLPVPPLNELTRTVTPPACAACAPTCVSARPPANPPKRIWLRRWYRLLHRLQISFKST